MNATHTVSLLGGDGRIGHIADRWACEGHTVRTYAVPREGKNEKTLSAALQNADVVVLPVPFTKDGKTLFAPSSPESIRIDEIRALIPSEALILCGGALEGAVNYADTESFQLLNAVPTAEGAIQLAMENTKITVSGARVLVVGAGRIGKILAKKLKHLDALVTASARKESDFAFLKARDIVSVPTSDISRTASRYDIVINTVPAPVIDKEFLSAMRPNALLLDLASMPGGTDFNEASRLSVHAIHALGLPNQVAPQTAADILKTVLETEIDKRK